MICSVISWYLVECRLWHWVVEIQRKDNASVNYLATADVEIFWLWLLLNSSIRLTSMTSKRRGFVTNARCLPNIMATQREVLTSRRYRWWFVSVSKFGIEHDSKYLPAVQCLSDVTLTSDTIWERLNGNSRSGFSSWLVLLSHINYSVFLE